MHLVSEKKMDENWGNSRQAAAVPNGPLAWELPYATEAALKRQKKEGRKGGGKEGRKERKKERRLFSGLWCRPAATAPL